MLLVAATTAGLRENGSTVVVVVESGYTLEAGGYCAFFRAPENDMTSLTLYAPVSGRFECAAAAAKGSRRGGTST